VNDHPDGHDTAPSAGAERWVYGGIRVLDGKRVYAWIDPSGRELLFTLRPASASAIGSYYTAQVSRHAGNVTLHGTPTYADDGQADDELRRQLWAQDTAARGHLARLAQERNEARRHGIDEALQPLLSVARTVKTGPDRDALTAYVLRRLIGAWYTPPAGRG
jgi:hypothetical protein